jgi:hypothetical protein
MALMTIARRAGITGAALLVLVLPLGPPSAATRVIAIYPTIDRVPANLLKLYVEFSAPMSDGEAEQRLHLYDARGHEMPRAFLHVDTELWNDAHTRLTVLFDPGRIKRGLRANLEEGAPLIEGETFRLAIDAAWRDGHGMPLANGFERTLTVGADDRTSPDSRRWTVTAPQIGTHDAVTVRFDEPLDRALLDRWLVVVDAAGAVVPGHASVGVHEQSWSFVPEHAWRADRYQVLINPLLEDLAGNSLVSLFDADMDARPHRDATAPLALPFTPRASTS